MFCEKCGKQIPDDSRVCEFCGSSVTHIIPFSDAEPVAAPETNLHSEESSVAVKGNDSKHSPAKLILIIVLAIAVVIGLFMAIKSAGSSSSDSGSGEYEDDFDVALGRAKLLVEVNIREHPSTNAQKNGSLKKGAEVLFYGTYEDGQYTWYQLESGNWIADDGTWLAISYDSEQGFEKSGNNEKENETENIDEPENVNPVIHTGNEANPDIDPWSGLSWDELAEWVKETIISQSNIVESRADDTFHWYIEEQRDTHCYYVYYKGDFFGFVYEADCLYDTNTGELTWTESYHDDYYDPDENYDWTDTLDEPFTQTVHSGIAAEVLNAIKAHCTWYDDWYNNWYPNGLTQGDGCDWGISQIGENTWTGTLYVWGVTNFNIYYDFICEWNGGEFVITSEHKYDELF